MKLAFCFLIYDEINNEELWYNFFKNIDKNKYNIYIHYKTQKPLQYFEQYKLTNCIHTNYEDETIVHAYNILFKRAYEDIQNYKFIILSGSCIPLKSFNQVYEFLTKDNYGHFNIAPTTACFPNCNSLLTKIETKYISKSSNWFILNRELLKTLAYIEVKKIDDLYKHVYAPAEYYYYTFIKINNMEDQIVTTNNISADATTFTNWSNNNYKYDDVMNKLLKYYKYITIEELDYLLASKSLFGRKFNKDCILINTEGRELCEYMSSKWTTK